MGDFDRDRNFDRRRSGRGRFDRRSGGFGGRDRGRGGDRGRDRPFERHEMHSGICDKCGKDCEVPFRPTQGKPLFCDDCFKAKSREAGSRSEFGKPNNNGNFDQLNKKLDKILRILESKPIEERPKSKKPKSVEEEEPKLEYAGSEENKKPKKKKAKKKKS